MCVCVVVWQGGEGKKEGEQVRRVRILGKGAVGRGLSQLHILRREAVSRFSWAHEKETGPPIQCMLIYKY